MNSRVLVVALFLLVSGICALIFQTAWLREFRLIFGASTPASAAVLAIFMGGLGLGNAVLGRRVDASPNPLRLYAMFELGISAACVASPFLIVLVRSVYFSLGGQDTLGITGATIVRLLLSTLVIGVPTFLMGGTLPAAARAATAAGDRARGSRLAVGLGTLGRIGTLASTFVLLEMLGRDAVHAAAVNIINALLAYRLAREYRVAKLAEGDDSPEPAPVPTKTPESSPRRKADGKHRAAPPVSHESLPPVGEPEPAPAWLLYAVAALVGFAFLLMEIVWYRMLGPILGGTTFTFGIILAVALAGIGVGGRSTRCSIARARSHAPRSGPDVRLGSIGHRRGAGAGRPSRAARCRAPRLERFGFNGQATGWAILAMIVILPAAIISGLQFPLLIALLGRGRRDLGRQVGQVTAWNTLGAMAGSLAGGFGLLPLLTAPGAWRMVVVLLAGLSLVALAMSSRTARSLRALVLPLGIAVLAGLCLTATGPTAVWRHSSIGAGRAQMPDNTHNDLKQWVHSMRGAIIWQADGQESSVAISALGASRSWSTARATATPSPTLPRG
jgi:hypothetical protein